MQEKQNRTSTRAIGVQMEKEASSYLTQQGVKLIETNFRSKQGEIDIIGFHNHFLVFFEVKYRRSLKQGLPEMAVTYQKQKKICKAADYYRYTHHYGDNSPFRYDVISILGNGESSEIKWYQNAFDHIM